MTEQPRSSLVALDTPGDDAGDMCGASSNGP